MSFLLWQTAALDETDAARVHLASTRRVFGAAEVSPLREAAEVLRQVHERARAQAQQLDAAREAARQQGHAEGLARGLQAARDDVAQRLAGLDRDARSRADDLRGQIAMLALAAVQKMLGELPFAQGLVAASAQAARDVLPDQRVTLHVHPSRVAEVRAQLAASNDSSAAMVLPARTEVLPDPLLGSDDGRLETAHGSIQVGLETQLARLAQAWGVPRAVRAGISSARDSSTARDSSNARDSSTARDSSNARDTSTARDSSNAPDA